MRHLRSKRLAALAAVAAATAAVVVVVGAAGPTAARSPAAAAPERPNIVFVLTDDLSSNLVRYMPHVKAMMRHGMTFTNYVVTDSLCCPSRSSILTGRFPHDTGVFTNDPPDGGFQIFNQRGNQHRTFATALRARGYRTALMGKYLNGYVVRQWSGLPAPKPPGWTYWAATDEGYEQFDYTLDVDGRRLVPHGHQPADYMTRVLGTLGEEFVARAADAQRPFLLELSTFAPHNANRGPQNGHAIPAPRDRRSFPGARSPRGPSFDTENTQPPVWLARPRPLRRGQVSHQDYLFRKRAQSVQSVDRMIGRLEATLRQRGVRDDTYLVFSSDNGFHLGQHRLTAGKETAFDHDIRVPLVVVGPGVPQGRRSDELIQNIDLAPTFERLAGARIPAGVDGHGIVPLLHGGPPPVWRRTALIEHHGPDLGPDDPDYQPGPSGRPTTYEAIRTPDSLYVEYRDGEREFYDLTRDPNERHNIVGRLSPSRLARLHVRLRKLARCHGGRACWAAATRRR